MLLFRQDEAWAEGGRLDRLTSAVPDPERLGAVNFASTAHMLCGLGPSADTLARLERTLAFFAARDNRNGSGGDGWRPVLAASPGVVLEPLRPSAHMVEQIRAQATQFKAILTEAAGGGEGGGGGGSSSSSLPGRTDAEQTTRKFQDLELETKREKDRRKWQLLSCAFPGCKRQERHPHELSRCSGCKAVACK